MPTFRYTAKRGPRDIVEGTLEADNRSGALTQLAELGYVPVQIREQAASPALPSTSRPVRTSTLTRSAKPARIPAAHLTMFTRQFASLVRSFVPLLRALNILEDQARHPYFRHVLHEIAESVRQGETLSTALGRFPQVFSPLYATLVQSGELSGALDVILGQLAQQAERDDALRAKVRMALTYPAVIGAVGLGTVVFLMTFVMPRLAPLLTGLGDRLPMATRLLLAISAVLSSAWSWVALGGLALGAVGLWRSAGESGRLLRDRLLLRLPLLGPLVRESELARFARSLGLQITHGISVLRGLDISAQVVTHRIIRAQLARLPEGLRQGEALSACLKGLPLSTPLLVHTIEVGEEHGKVGEALTEVAGYYEQEVERRLQTITTLLEPLLMLVVGAVVGFIVFAVLLPIFEMSSINL